MNIKDEAMAVAKTAKFEGVSVHANAVNSRLVVNVEIRGSVDLPGDSDVIVANLLGMVGLGNSKPLSTPSES